MENDPTNFRYKREILKGSGPQLTDDFLWCHIHHLAHPRSHFSPEMQRAIVPGSDEMGLKRACKNGGSYCVAHQCIHAKEEITDYMRGKPKSQWYCTGMNASSGYGARQEKAVEKDQEYAGSDTETLGDEEEEEYIPRVKRKHVESEEEVVNYVTESDSEEEEERNRVESESEEELEENTDFLDVFFAKHRPRGNLYFLDVPALVGLEAGSILYVMWSPRALYAKVSYVHESEEYTNGRISAPIVYVTYAKKGPKSRHVIVDDRRLYDMDEEIYLTWYHVPASSKEAQKLTF